MKITGPIPDDLKEALRAAVRRTDYLITSSGRGTARHVPYLVALAQAVATLRGGWKMQDKGGGEFVFSDPESNRRVTFTPVVAACSTPLSIHSASRVLALLRQPGLYHGDSGD
jgi:hypothetical protein